MGFFVASMLEIPLHAVPVVILRWILIFTSLFLIWLGTREFKWDNQTNQRTKFLCIGILTCLGFTWGMIHNPPKIAQSAGVLDSLQDSCLVREPYKIFVTDYGSFQSKYAVRWQSLDQPPSRHLDYVPEMDHLCRYVKSIRQYFYNKLQRYDDPTSYWLKTFILSERSALPSPIQEDFKVTGLQHLLALSGGHIVIVLVFFQMLLRWPLNAAYTARCVTMRCWPLLCKWAHSTSILCTLIYSLTAGFGGPLQRATVTLLVREIFMVKGIEASKLQIIKIALFVNIAMFPIGFLNIGSFLSWIGSIYLVGQLKPKISLGHSMIVAIKHQLFFCVLSTFIFSQMNLSSIITNLVLALLISSVTYLDLWLTFVISPEWNFIANVGNEIHKVFLELIAMLGDFSQAFTPTPISIHPTLLHFALVCLALFLLSRLNDHA